MRTAQHSLWNVQERAESTLHGCTSRAVYRKTCSNPRPARWLLDVKGRVHISHTERDGPMLELCKISCKLWDNALETEQNMYNTPSKENKRPISRTFSPAQHCATLQRPCVAEFSGGSYPSLPKYSSLVLAIDSLSGSRTARTRIQWSVFAFTREQFVLCSDVVHRWD